MTLLVIGYAKVEESAEALTTFLKLTDFENMYDSYSVYFVADLKVVATAHGLTSGNSRYPCPICTWRSTGVSRDEHFGVFELRDYSHHKEYLANVQEDGKAPKDNFSIEKNPASELFVRDSNLTVPPQLHIFSGTINHVADFLKEKDPLLKKQWEKISKITSERGYHGGTYGV